MRGFAARGKTVVFATHYLEEADAYADRIVLMAHGRVVADGPATEIKARVGMRTIRATLPGVDLAALAALPGVAAADRRGDAVMLACSDSDRAIRALLRRPPERPRHRDHAAPASRRPSCELTGDDAAEAAEPEEVGRDEHRPTYTRFEVLRTFRNPRFFIFSLVFPLTHVPAHRGAQPATSTTSLGSGDLRAALLHGRPDRVRAR